MGKCGLGYILRKTDCVRWWGGKKKTTENEVGKGQWVHVILVCRTNRRPCGWSGGLWCSWTHIKLVCCSLLVVSSATVGGLQIEYRGISHQWGKGKKLCEGKIAVMMRKNTQCSHCCRLGQCGSYTSHYILFPVLSFRLSLHLSVPSILIFPHHSIPLSLLSSLRFVSYSIHLSIAALYPLSNPFHPPSPPPLRMPWPSVIDEAGFGDPFHLISVSLSATRD